MRYLKRHLRRLAPVVLAATTAMLAACAGDEADGVELVSGQPSEAKYPDAEVRIEAPLEGQVVDTAAPGVKLSVDGFELGATTPGAEERGLARSAKGQHVHLILDTRPYQAVYDVGGTVQLSGTPLEPGLHVLRAFASRQWHESVKSPEAFDVTYFFVGDTAAEGTSTEPPYGSGTPLLTYSRPKGTYEGADADSIMVDFHLRNTELGPQAHRIRLTVNDTTDWTFESWAPHYLVGLGDGEHEIRLELLDPEGQPAPGPFNTTVRTIQVRRDTASGGGN